MSDESIIDLAPRFTGKGDADETPAAPTYACDHVVVQIVVSRHEGGHKVGEVPFNAVKLLWPYDLASVIEQAIATAIQACAEAQQ